MTKHAELDKKIPDFSVVTTTNEALSPAALVGKKWVLYFYPKDDTPGCTRESQDFRDNHDQFKHANTVILGVSRDSIKSHQNFIDKQELPFDLIADTDELLCNLFNVMREKNLYGKTVVGVERSTFLIDDQGILRKEWRKVKVDGHVAEILAATKTLD